MVFWTTTEVLAKKVAIFIWPISMATAVTAAGGREEVGATFCTLFPRTQSICMIRSFLAAAAVLTVSVSFAGQSSAQGVGPSPFGFGFQPFGFYQPYGARYGTSIRTPPYFATNPPVYYGARHARPYGISPFASPPVVSPGPSYRSRLRSDFHEPATATPGPHGSGIYSPAAGCNCYTHRSRALSEVRGELVEAGSTGPIRENPFVNDFDRLALN